MCIESKQESLVIFIFRAIFSKESLFWFAVQTVGMMPAPKRTENENFCFCVCSKHDHDLRISKLQHQSHICLCAFVRWLSLCNLFQFILDTAHQHYHFLFVRRPKRRKKINTRNLISPALALRASKLLFLEIRFYKLLISFHSYRNECNARADKSFRVNGKQL